MPTGSSICPGVGVSKAYFHGGLQCPCPASSQAADLVSPIETFGLSQIISAHTHVACRMLDFIFVAGLSVGLMQVIPVLWSDHVVLKVHLVSGFLLTHRG